MAEKDIRGISIQESNGYKYLFCGSVDGEGLHRKDLFGIHRCKCVHFPHDEEFNLILIRRPQEYWAERDETGQYPHELHAALAQAGWIGIALPEELGGAGLGISEATMMMQTISQYESLSFKF